MSDEPLYSVVNADGKTVVKDAPRAKAVRVFDATKQRDGRAPTLVRQED